MKAAFDWWLEWERGATTPARPRRPQLPRPRQVLRGQARGGRRAVPPHRPHATPAPWSYPDRDPYEAFRAARGCRARHGLRTTPPDAPATPHQSAPQLHSGRDNPAHDDGQFEQSSDARRHRTTRRVPTRGISTVQGAGQRPARRPPRHGGPAAVRPRRDRPAHGRRRRHAHHVRGDGHRRAAAAVRHPRRRPRPVQRRLRRDEPARPQRRCLLRLHSPRPRRHRRRRRRPGRPRRLQHRSRSASTASSASRSPASSPPTSTPRSPGGCRRSPRVLVVGAARPAEDRPQRPGARRAAAHRGDAGRRLRRLRDRRPGQAGPVAARLQPRTPSPARASAPRCASASPPSLGFEQAPVYAEETSRPQIARGPR